MRWINDKLKLYKSIDKEQTRFLQDVKKKFEMAYRQINANVNNKVNYSIQKLTDGTEYFQTEDNLFLKEDGSEMSQIEMFNSLVGKKIEFNDGIEATIVKKLPNKEIYKELFVRYPTYKNINDINIVNKTINKNMMGMLANTDNISPNEPDYKNRHAKNNIVSFDTRRVSFYDGKKAYNLDFSIAKLKDGTYVAYAKRFLESNNKLLNKIKKENTASKSRVTSLSNQNISQNKENVKHSISKELDNSSFNLEQTISTQDNLVRTLTNKDNEKVVFNKKSTPTNKFYETLFKNIDDVDLQKRINEEISKGVADYKIIGKS